MIIVNATTMKRLSAKHFNWKLLIEALQEELAGFNVKGYRIDAGSDYIFDGSCDIILLPPTLLTVEDERKYHWDIKREQEILDKLKAFARGFIICLKFID